MENRFKKLTDFFLSVDADKVEHTNKSYLAHCISVYNDLKQWGSDLPLCEAAMFHSIYSTELFQKFGLPLSRRAELQELIGERAERLAYYNCAMDRATFDREAYKTEGPFLIVDRFTEQEIEITPEDFEDLCNLHLCDWLEQVERSGNWDYRRDGYQQLAKRLGGIAEESHGKVFAREAAA